jgi:hypothetical protein
MKTIKIKSPKITELIGVVAAIAYSWDTNHSIGYAAIHGVCGWFYVIYHVIAY